MFGSGMLMLSRNRSYFLLHATISLYSRTRNIFARGKQPLLTGSAGRVLEKGAYVRVIEGSEFAPQDFILSSRRRGTNLGHIR